VQALVDPGDEVVLVDPAWVSHDFQLEPAMGDLTAAVDDDVTVISDEIYGKLTYDGGYTSCGTGSRL
jgi:aspartate/methionine/tyrosine aminotransferase